jgi:D-alanine-D-alanine ligase
VKRLRVLALTHEKLVPPDSLDGLTPAQIGHFKMEYHVIRALRELGHDVRVLGLGEELQPLRQAIDDWRPHVTFNFLAHFQNVGCYDAYVMSFLELMRIPYTGCNPRGMLQASDKALSKKVMAYHRIPTPAFAVFRRGHRVRPPRRVRFPLFVKSLDEHSSLGIAQASIVHDLESLQERVRFVHEYIGSDAIAEEYIRGRELNVAVIGNDRLRALPVWELVFENLTRGAEPIATYRVKWDPRYQDKLGVQSRPAVDLGEAQARLPQLARRIYRALGLSGYARIDFRLSDAGQIYVLEANPNPDLSPDEDFAQAWAAAGLDYLALVRRVLQLALSYRPAWKLA